MPDHWSVTKLGTREYQESIDEMRHADWLIKRILFLDGQPNLQRLNALMIGQTPEEVLRCAATCRGAHPSPHFAPARNPPNIPLLTNISANRCISGSSRCSGMLGISS